jgi:hypothetical protein
MNPKSDSYVTFGFGALPMNFFQNRINEKESVPRLDYHSTCGVFLLKSK